MVCVKLEVGETDQPSLRTHKAPDITRSIFTFLFFILSFYDLRNYGATRPRDNLGLPKALWRLKQARGGQCYTKRTATPSEGLARSLILFFSFMHKDQIYWFVICILAILIVLLWIGIFLPETKADTLADTMEQSDGYVDQLVAKDNRQPKNSDGSYRTMAQQARMEKTNCTVWQRWIGALPYIEYTYDVWGDMDFIGTIAAESMWHADSVGDRGRAFGYCQLDIRHQKTNGNIRAYKALKNNYEKIAFCHRLYTEWKTRGVIKTRLYGYNVRARWLAKMQISCK